MVVLNILLGILALLALLLYLPLRIALTYDGQVGLQYKLYYACFCLADSSKEKLVTEEEPKPAISKEKKKKEGSSGADTLLSFLGLEDIASIANVRRALDEKGLCQMLSDIGSAVKDLLSTTGRLIGKGRFHRFTLRIIVGDSDMGDAALHYGRVCALLYPILGSIKAVQRCKKRRIAVHCDFLREESLVYFEGQLQYRPWHFVGFLGGLIWNNIKRSVKGT